MYVYLGMWIVGEVGDRDGFFVSFFMDIVLEVVFWNFGLVLGWGLRWFCGFLVSIGCSIFMLVVGYGVSDNVGCFNVLLVFCF